MKAKRFFMHTGLALGYLLLFILLQSWASGLLTTGIVVPMFFESGPFGFMLTETEIMDRVMVFNDAIILIVYIVCAVYYGLLMFAENPKKPLHAANLRVPKNGAMMWTPLVVGFGMFFAVQGAFMLIPEDAPIMQDYIEAAQALEYGSFPVLNFLATVFGAPIVEEVVFRGLAYRHLKKALPVWLALIVQALAFGIAHGQLLWLVYTAVLGVLLGLMYDYFDSLWPGILLHFTFNACNYLPFLESLMLDMTGWLILMLASLLLCALTGLMMLVYRRMRVCRIASEVIVLDRPAQAWPEPSETARTGDLPDEEELPLPDVSAEPMQASPAPAARAVKGVLFDFNGTLFFDGEFQEKAWRAYIARLIGREVTDEEFVEHIHGRSAAATFSHFLGREVLQPEAALLEEQKELIYRDLCLKSDAFRLADGVPEFLDALQSSGIPFTIATASAKNNVQFFFEHLPLSRWFDPDKVVYSDGTIPGKPAPDLYLKAAEKIGCDASECAVFEDAKSGVLAAKNANAALVVGIPSSLDAAALKGFGADIVLETYGAEVMEMLK